MLITVLSSDTFSAIFFGKLGVFSMALCVFHGVVTSDCVAVSAFESFSMFY